MNQINMNRFSSSVENYSTSSHRFLKIYVAGRKLERGINEVFLTWSWKHSFYVKITLKPLVLSLAEVNVMQQ